MRKISIAELSEKTNLKYNQIYFLIRKGLLSAEKVYLKNKKVYLLDEENALKEIEELKRKGIIIFPQNWAKIRLPKEKK